MRFAAQTHLAQIILYFDILEAWSQSTSSFERFCRYISSEIRRVNAKFFVDIHIFWNHKVTAPRSSQGRSKTVQVMTSATEKPFECFAHILIAIGVNKRINHTVRIMHPFNKPD